MDAGRVAELYRERVVDPGLERSDLLELVLARTRARTVLYPGCSIHVTPSRFFEHVVYVDRSEVSRAFFADPAQVLGVVRGDASARAGASLRFLAADFTAPLPLPEGSFDLLLALGAGGVTRACHRYVRTGGFVLSDDHEGDAFEARSIGGLRLVAAALAAGRRLRLEESDLEGLLAPAAPPPGRRARGPRRAGRPHYRRTAAAYLFVRDQSPVIRSAPV